jgi:hypothetical protein
MEYGGLDASLKLVIPEWRPCKEMYGTIFSFSPNFFKICLIEKLDLNADLDI